MRSEGEHLIGHHAREPEVVRRVGQCLNLVSREVRRDRLLLGEQVRQRPILLQRLTAKVVDKIIAPRRNRAPGRGPSSRLPTR